MNSQESVIDVAGMSCGSCVHHVDEALAALRGVQQVDVQLATGRVQVVHDPELTSVEALVAAITDAGYEAKARSPALSE